MDDFIILCHTRWQLRVAIAKMHCVLAVLQCRVHPNNGYVGGDDSLQIDSEGRIRLDDLEMKAQVQQAVADTWSLITSENISELTGLELYQQDFYQLFGFGFDNVDYDADVDPNVSIESLSASDV